MNTLTSEERVRYGRQILILGEDAQERLKSSHVAIFGVGGLGSVVALYLVAAGVGKVTLVDRDRVELSDLNRQILYDTHMIGKIKVWEAKQRLEHLNPNVQVRPIQMDINESIRSIIRHVDVVVDCLDNWKARYVVNEACVREGKILVHGGIRGFYGQVTIIVPKKTACLCCITGCRARDDERVLPVIGTTSAVIGAIQANETIKILTGYGMPIYGKFLIYDGYTMEFEVLNVERKEDCPVCGVD